VDSGYAIDNAIEACAKLKYEENKTISISSAYKNGFLLIKIENPTAGDVKVANNNIVTTKNKKDLSGIGLQSIKIAVEKYFGDMTLSYVGGTFSLEIELDFNMQVEL